MIYRREIDGLRALAVIPVILFHAGSNWFGSGFAGVDIFFVISGYLITSLILQDLADGSFSFARFYERRARRILPVLFLVLACCLPAAWIWLLPEGRREFAQSLMAVSSFLSNVLFWKKSGYFDIAADFKPLLHTWSLGVEEQFYMLFPILLATLWKRARPLLLPILFTLTLCSLASSLWFVDSSPDAVFYLLPSRAWELLLGVLAACHGHTHPNTPEHRAAPALSLAGLLLVLAGLIQPTQAPYFPGSAALLTTLGSSLIILFTRPSAMAGRLLGCRPLVGIGLISYSLYLWHQPIFAFMRLSSPLPPSPNSMLLLSLLIVPLAWLSWRLVERPCRDPQRTSSGTMLAVTLFGTIAFFLLGALGHLSNGFAHNNPLPQTIVESLRESPRQQACFSKPFMHTRADWLCDLGKADAPASFMVVGDSHSAALIPAFDVAAAELGSHGLYSGNVGCPPLLGIDTLNPDPEQNCRAFNERVFALVKAQGIKRIFLVGRWTYYTEGGYNGNDYIRLARSRDERSDKAQSIAIFAEAVPATLRAYREIGVSVVIVQQVPQQLGDPGIAFRHAYSPDRQAFTQTLQQSAVPRPLHEEMQAGVRTIIDMAAAAEGATTLMVDNLFCDAEICAIGTPEHSYYYDPDHLSPPGALRIVPLLTPLLSMEKP